MSDLFLPGDIGTFCRDTILFETLGTTYDPKCTVPEGSIFVVCAPGDAALGNAKHCYMVLTSYGIGWIINYPCWYVMGV
jgi:hypothetical protein